jgi:hypothetical protein
MSVDARPTLARSEDRPERFPIFCTIFPYLMLLDTFYESEYNEITLKWKKRGYANKRNN